MDLETAKQLTPEDIVALFQSYERLQVSQRELEQKEQHFFVDDAQRQCLESELLESKARLETRTSELETARTELEEAKRMIKWYQRQLFGAKSERRILNALGLADQLWLGEQFLATPEKPPKKKITVRQFEREYRRKSTELVAEDSQLRFDDTVPVEVIEVVNPQLDGVSEDQIEIIDERVTYRLAQRSPYVVLKLIQKVAKIKGEEGVSCPPSPLSIFPGSSADVSFLAGLIVDKFRCHLPLYRQHQRLEASGVFINRATLTRLVHRVGELMEPIFHALFSSILLSSVLGVDETPTPAGRKNGKTKSGYYWIFFGDQNEVAFLFSPRRAQSVLDVALAGFEGKLLCDGYIAYEGFAQANPEVTLCQCWNHTRREFLKAENQEPEKVESFLLSLQQLYKIEEEARDKTPEQRLALRQKHSKPIVETLFEDLEDHLSETALLPSSPFVKAAKYATARKTELQVFLQDPKVQIDTNHVERALRPQAVGRKNWMFHSTEVGARHGAIFYSLIQSCVLAEVDPTTYFVDVLQRIYEHPAEDVHLLTPRLWKMHFQDAPLRSLLDQKSDSS